MAAPKHIRRLRRSEGIKKFIEALEHDGGVIITDFTDVGTVDQANAK